MRIDLTHSHISDGTESPADLVTAAAAAGLDVVALTDHDQTADPRGPGPGLVSACPTCSRVPRRAGDVVT